MIPCAIERCRVNIRVDIQYFHRTVNGIWRTREACFRKLTKKGSVFMMHLTSCFENNRFEPETLI